MAGRDVATAGSAKVRPLGRRGARYAGLQSYLSGTVEVTASDGEFRRFGPGSLLLLEDTHGKGHSTRVLDEDVVMLVTQLAATEPGADLATPPEEEASPPH